MRDGIVRAGSVVFFTILLAACGGGSGYGGGSSGPQLQSIAFAQTGTLQVLNGFTTTNVASGGAGSGAITYASSNSTAVTVNSISGLATAVAPGTATITATKAADANYAQAQATYLLTVQTQAPVSAWIGPSDAQVTLPSTATGAQFIRSKDRNCNLASYSTCLAGQLNVAAGTPITDTVVNTSSMGYYWLQGASTATNTLPVNARRFSERVGHGALFFNGRYWVIAGSLSTVGAAKADVWSSVDGKTWELETSTPGFAPRWIIQSVVYNGKMWVIGGINAANNNLVNDVWSSPDGINWTQVAATTTFTPMTHEDLSVTVFNNAMWAVFNGTSYSSTDGITWTPKSTTPIDSGSPRGYASLTVYANKLWYIGGAPGWTGSGGGAGTSVNDVWSSPDGISWTKVTANAGFTPRWRHTSFVMNNRLWVLGGQGVTAGALGAITPDAWSTTDGVSWTKEVTAAGMGWTYFVTAVQETNKVTLIGGVMRGISNRVWQSTDGNQWTDLSSFAQFTPRENAQVVEFLGDLWLVGGFVTEALETNEIWRSSDGINWSRVTTVGTIFSPRDAHQAVVFNGRLWVIGGWDNVLTVGGTGTRYNDVWSTADGVNWTKHTPASTIFSPRMDFQAVVFNNKLWVIGGSTDPNVYANDVWSTADGVNWVPVTASAAFTPRSGHGVVAFNNALWMFGGRNTSVLADIWKSTDGATWTPVTPVTTSFAARSVHSVAVYNNRMWLTGGWNGLDWNTGPDFLTAGRFNDVWSTTDGATWTRNTAAAQFDPRAYTSLVNHNNELWLVGGFNYDRFNDVWRSTDGANWRVGFSQNFTTH